MHLVLFELLVLKRFFFIYNEKFFRLFSSSYTNNKPIQKYLFGGFKPTKLRVNSRKIKNVGIMDVIHYARGINAIKSFKHLKKFPIMQTATSLSRQSFVTRLTGWRKKIFRDFKIGINIFETIEVLLLI